MPPLADTMLDALLRLPALIPDMLLTDGLRYLIGAGGVFLVINTLFSERLAGRKIRDDSPDAAQMRREFAASMRSILIFSISGLLVAFELMMGWTQFYADPAEHGWLWFTVSVALLLVLHDAWFYWTHRLIHHPRLFRRFHRLHHKSHNPSPWTAYAFDTGEAVIQALYIPVVVLLLPVSFLATFLWATHMILRNAIGHCGYELFPAGRDGRPLFGWMTTVTHHDLHHAQAGWNYGLYFSWWDKWMGTEHPDYLDEFRRVTQTGSGTHTPAPQSASSAQSRGSTS